MNRADRYQTFDIYFDSQSLNLVTKSSQEICFSLRELHIRTCDSLTKKASDATHLNYCAYLEIASSKNKLKLHFMSFEAMSSIFESILNAQGFENRLAQYDHETNLPNALVCSRSVVRHRLTGKRYELKRFDMSDEANLHVF